MKKLAFLLLRAFHGIFNHDWSCNIRYKLSTIAPKNSRQRLK